MPLTPFHLGPALLIGIVFQRQINIAAILFASTIIDVRAIYCFFNNCQLHGPLHTYLGGMLFSLVIILVIYASKKPLRKLSDKFRVNQNYSLKSIVIGALIGVWSHVFLDSFMHFDITPFWPLLENPFLGVISNSMNYGITIIGFIAGGIIYFYKIYKLNNQG